MRKVVLTSLAIGVSLMLSRQASAQSTPPAQAAPPAYGESINLEKAKKAAAAAADK